jgi:hypothetical protein
MATKRQLYKIQKLCSETSDMLKRSAGKKFRELNIANGAAFSTELVSIIKETDKKLRAIWDHYITQIARSFASKIVKVEVKTKKRTIKMISYDNSLMSDFDLDEIYAVSEEDALELSDDIEEIIGTLGVSLLACLKQQQQTAYLLGLKKSYVTLNHLDPKDIDPGLLNLSDSDLQALHRDLESQEKHLKKFMEKLKDKYDSLLYDSPDEETAMGYESPQELMSAVEGVDTTSIHQLDMYAIASMESAMMLGSIIPHQQAGVSGGIWHTMHDGVVCPDCMALDGTWMTWDEFSSVYKNTLCDGSCRCGELFEQTNNMTDPYSDTYGKDYYMGDQPETMPCIKPLGAVGLGKIQKIGDTGAAPNSIGCALVQNAEKAARKSFNELSKIKRSVAKTFAVSPKVNFSELGHFFTPSSAQFKGQFYRALNKFDDATAQVIKSKVRDVRLVTTAEFVEAGGEATNAVLYNESIYINSELTPYSLGNDLYKLLDALR